MTALAYALKLQVDQTLPQVKETAPASVSAMEATTSETATEPGWRERLRDLIGMPQPSTQTVPESLQEKLDALLEYEQVAIHSETEVDWGRSIAMDTSVLETDEIIWLQEHAEIWTEFAGNWIAVKGGKVLASGVEPGEVLDSAKRSGAENPLLFKVPALKRTHFYAND